MSKHTMDNIFQILTAQSPNNKVQHAMKDLTNSDENVNKIFSSVVTSLKDIPTKRELRHHARAMEELDTQIDAVTTR